MSFNKSIHTQHRILLSLTMAATMLLASCSVNKFIAPGDKVLRTNKYSVEMPDGNQTPKEVKEALKDMRKYARQKPNSRLLGFGPRLKMRIYCLSNPDKNSWLNRYLRNQGQEPVVYSEDASLQTCSDLASMLESKGCFRSTVTVDTIHKKDNDVVVTYHIKPSPRYLIDEFTVRAETPEINTFIREWNSESLIKEGDYYNQEVLNAERTRLSERLRNEGYYYASPSLISFMVDTNFNDNTLAIRLNMRNPRQVDSSGHTTVLPLQKYRIDKIFIYPNSSTVNKFIKYDTLVTSLSFRNFTTNYYYLSNQPIAVKPKVINRNIFLFHRQTFRPRSIEQTYNSLLNLRNFKFINIEFSESPNSCDTNRLLNATIKLLNAKKQRFTLSAEINNSSPFGEQSQGLLSGNVGFETKVGYQNKNLFGGAELFMAEMSLLIELPKLALKNNENSLFDNLTSFEHGLDLSLDMPSFLFPFTGDVLWQRMRPHTIFNLGFNYQYRSYFERMLFNTGFGYNWNRNRNAHQLKPIEMTFVRFFNIDSTFKARMESISDARVKYQYSDHFIMDARYDYVINTQQFNTRQDFNYLHLSVEVAGNLLNAISILTDGSIDANGVREVLGVPFSQYFRVNAEYKHYFYLGEKSTFVARVMAGMGLPYANSHVMPYEKSFYGGGPTTIRAWHLRHLGPGTFQNNSSNAFERVGDIQFVANLEYRFPMFSVIEGAVFADFGNVWLTRESTEFPGGTFNFKTLPESIATGIGLGIRANISIVTLRCDFATALYDPGMVKSERWQLHKWKPNRLIVNFGIDYPF